MSVCGVGILRTLLLELNIVLMGISPVYMIESFALFTAFKQHATRDYRGHTRNLKTASMDRKWVNLDHC